MSLCQSIDTLAMAFLDDELAAEERRELELHLLGCASCRGHVDGERAELALVRKALVAPPASALLKARIARALDAEDDAAARSERRRWSRWLLPGSSMAAAAAAIALFLGAGLPGTRGSAVTEDLERQKHRELPLEVQGANTGGWLRAHFAPVEPPQFTEPGIELLGARLLPNGIGGHDAAQLTYRVTIGDSRVQLNAIVLKGVRGDEFRDGQAVRVGNLVLRTHDLGGVPAVTYVAPNSVVGYVFLSPRLSAEELVELVVSSDVIARAQGR